MYPGIDLHERYAQVVIIDSEGQIVEKVRVKNVNLDDLARRHAGSRVVIETTSNYYHVYDTFAEYLDVVVAHPSKLTLITHPDEKADRVDIKRPARLLQLNSVPQNHVPTDEIKQAYAFVRGRQTLAEDRTKFTNKIHGLPADNGTTHEVKPLSVGGREFLRGFPLPPPQGALLEPHPDVVETLTEQMTQLEVAIGKRAGPLKETQLLMATPGVSYYSVLLIYTKPGEADRFDSHEEVVNYVGLNPTIREFGDSRIEGGISKRGPGRARWILVQSAYSAVYTCKDEYLSRLFHQLNRRMNLKKAIAAAT